MENILNFKPKGKRITSVEKRGIISEGHSYCSKCESVKLIKEFGKDKSNRYSIDPICKVCRRDLATQRRVDFPDRVKEVRRNSRNKNKEYYNTKKKDWDKSNRDYINSYKRKKYNNEPEYKMQVFCRQIVRRMFKSTGVKKCYKTQEILGYTPLELKQHIEDQFKEGMSWDNHGEWHVDHIVPISRAKSLAEGLVLSQLDNLQPLWAKENLIKSNK